MNMRKYLPIYLPDGKHLPKYENSMIPYGEQWRIVHRRESSTKSAFAERRTGWAIEPNPVILQNLTHRDVSEGGYDGGIWENSIEEYTHQERFRGVVSRSEGIDRSPPRLEHDGERKANLECGVY